MIILYTASNAIASSVHEQPCIENTPAIASKSHHFPVTITRTFCLDWAILQKAPSRLASLPTAFVNNCPKTKESRNPNAECDDKQGRHVIHLPNPCSN